MNRRTQLVTFVAATILLGGCGGGAGSNPTEPRMVANVAGGWSGTSLGVVTHGPSCIGTGSPTPSEATISQNGPAISLSITFNRAITCEFLGTVGESTISWSPNPVQANANCLGSRGVPCLSGGRIRFIDITNRNGAPLNGTAVGNRISVSGVGISDVTDSTTGQLIDTLETSVSVELTRVR